MEGYDMEELEIYDTKRPKHIVDGMAKGTGNILKGAVGGVALMLGAPVKGAYDGAKEGGPVGALKGFGLGLGAGLVGGTAMAVGGVLTGTMQVSPVERSLTRLTHSDWTRHHINSHRHRRLAEWYCLLIDLPGLTRPREELRRGVEGVDRVQPGRGGGHPRGQGRGLHRLHSRCQPIHRRSVPAGGGQALGQVRETALEPC